MELFQQSSQRQDESIKSLLFYYPPCGQQRHRLSCRLACGAKAMGVNNIRQEVKARTRNPSLDGLSYREPAVCRDEPGQMKMEPTTDCSILLQFSRPLVPHGS